jgi:Ca-activated chloride channel family protein
VPDASRLSPPVAPPGTRAGHDIRLTIHLDAGTEIFDLHSTLHEIRSVSTGKGQATVTLANKAEIPNKDFILHYRTATDTIGDTVLLHTDTRGTFFTLIVQPPRRLRPEQAVPKEMLFVIDRSGSMSGFPIEKAKETMRRAIEQMNPHDTFNLLSFSGGTGRCFAAPVPNTPENRAMALRYLADLYGSGGTEMMPAILEALGGAHDPQRLRVVAFMTDGYIGDDYAIIDAVRQHAGTSRVFAFGIGNAVNRFLLDGMAHAGRGAVEYVTLQSQADAAVQRFHQRIQAPVLTDIRLDWGTLPVQDVYPTAFPDLFSSQPLVIHGRLAQAVEGTITLSGQTSTGHFSRHIRIPASASPVTHDTLPTLWARAAVAELLLQDYAAMQHGNMPAARRDQITALGVEFHLMTPFTSFVAVEELRVTVAGSPVTIAVPVEIPEGVRYEGIFGSRMVTDSAAPQARLQPMSLPAPPVFKSIARDARQAYRAEEESSGRVARGPQAAAKLAPSLVDLEQEVQKSGTDGTLTRDTLHVFNYLVDVMIYLRDTSAETLAALQQLGFITTAESKTVPLLIGRIDVRHLKQLIQLDAVLRVTPVTG